MFYLSQTNLKWLDQITKELKQSNMTFIARLLDSMPEETQKGKGKPWVLYKYDIGDAPDDAYKAKFLEGLEYCDERDRIYKRSTAEPEEEEGIGADI